MLNCQYLTLNSDCNSWPTWIQRVDRVVRPPWKITSCYMFSLKYWYGPPSRSNWTPRVQLLLEGGPYGPLLNTLIIKSFQDPPPPRPADGIFWIHAWGPLGTCNQLFIFHCRYKFCEQRGNCAASFAYVIWCSVGSCYLILLEKVCYTFLS